MATTRHQLEHDGCYLLPADVDEVWTRISDVDRFPHWWAWLHDFEVDGPGVADGGVLRGDVVPPLPYRFHVAVHLDEVVPAERILAHLTGDIAGRAELHLADHPDGCEATVRWSVELRQPALRVAVQVARSAVEWGHDRVVAATVRGFERVLEGPVSPTDGPVDPTDGPASQTDGAVGTSERRSRPTEG